MENGVLCMVRRGVCGGRMSGAAARTLMESKYNKNKILIKKYQVG